MNFSKHLNKFDIVISHGGAGITQTCIKHGVINLILATMVDQPFWGKLIE